MRFLVVGLGSMGKRRIRLLLKHFDDISIAGVDSQSARRDEAKEKYDIEVFSELETGIEVYTPDAIIICASPLGHKDIMECALKAGVHTFSEINLIDYGYDKVIAAEGPKSRHFLSSTFLYNREIEWIHNKEFNRTSYRYHSGQYLPDWHPWENYKDFFVANKETNGCREIMAIEFPWLVKSFGKITGVQVIKSRQTDLSIDYPDTFHLLLEHERGNSGSVTVDIVSRKAVRELEIFSETEYITWKGSPNSLESYSIEEKSMEPIKLYDNVMSEKGYADTIIENPYLEELKDFYKGIVDSNHEFRYSYSLDKSILNVIDVIEGKTDKEIVG